jgi:hypothetical protein
VAAARRFGSAWRAGGLAFALALAAAPVLPVPGRAADSTAVRPWYESVTLNGLLESSYSHNFNRPATRQNALRVFDTGDDGWRLDLLEVVLQKPVQQPGQGGFRFDLAAGSSVPPVEAAAGLFRDPATGKAGDVDLQQAYVTWLAGLGAGLRIDAGKFVTPMGYELIDGHDGYNDHATRSLLFGYAIPFTHTGLRLAYPVSPRLSTQLCVVNGWDNARDNNDARTVCVQLGWAPSAAVSVYLNGITGAEQADNDSSRRSVADLVLVVKPHPRLTLGLSADLGRESDALGPNLDAQWEGAAGYARATLSDRFAVAARGEYFKDRQGARTGTAQRVWAFTLTPEVRAADNLILRADLRHDASDAAVFDKRGAAVKTQTTLLFEAVVPF